MSKITGNVKEINWVTSWQYKCINRECPICRSELEIDSKKSCPVCNKNWIPYKHTNSKYRPDKKAEMNWIEYNNHINNQTNTGWENNLDGGGW
jgi:hypothetical protein